MKSTIVAAALSLALAGSAMAQTTGPGQTGQQGAQQGQQLTQAQCQSIWSRLNPSGAQQVSQAQAQPYMTDFKQADANSDGQISSSEFMSACQRGMVRDTAATGGGTGTGGAGTTGTGGTGSQQR